MFISSSIIGGTFFYVLRVVDLMILFCLFCCFTSQVNSYGYGGTVSSLNQTFFMVKLEQADNQYFVHILSLVTDNNPSWMILRKGDE